MPHRVRVASVHELRPDAGTLVKVEGRDLAFFTLADGIYAIAAACPHEDGPLQEGEVEGHTVYCPWHAYDFDVRTGACSVAPHLQVATFPVSVEGDDVFVELPD